MSAGIGLCRVKNVVEHLQGRINLKSAPGEGTTFAVWLPAEKLQKPGEGEKR